MGTTKSNKKKLPDAVIVLKSCADCPFIKIRQVYTEDSFETVFSWHCKKKKEKEIRGYVEWNDREKYVPDWCPLRKNK